MINTCQSMTNTVDFIRSRVTWSRLFYMAVYQNAYPPLAPVANPAATLSPKGNNILAGVPILPIHAVEAQADEKDRKREREVSGTVTVAEEHAAKRRRLAIELEDVQTTYAVAAPAWAQPLLPIPHMIRNDRLIRANSLLVAVPPVAVAAPVLGIRSKEVPSLMSVTAPVALAAITPQGVAVAVPAIVPVLGAIPTPLSAGGIYPTTEAEILALTHQQMMALVNWYNEDIGFVPGDPIGVRRNKVGRWIHL